MSSDECKTFIVTDTDIVDEGIDISGIKRKKHTRTLLIGDLETCTLDYPTLTTS